jgi:golgi-specific brefeldin A-resistance guanine nucleotide exchange factor 1
MQSPSQIINKEERANGAGLFSSFTSYLSSYAADDPPEPSDEEINDTLCTYDCLKACPLDTIFDNIMYVHER